MPNHCISALEWRVCHRNHLLISKIYSKFIFQDQWDIQCCKSDYSNENNPDVSSRNFEITSDRRQHLRDKEVHATTRNFHRAVICLCLFPNEHKMKSLWYYMNEKERKLSGTNIQSGTEKHFLLLFVWVSNVTRFHQQNPTIAENWGCVIALANLMKLLNI